MAGLQDFVAGVVIKVLSDEKVKENIESLIGNIIAKQILPIVPVAVGAAVKSGMDELIEKVPGISGTIDAVKATEAATASIVDSIPGLDSLPVIGDFLKAWGH